METQNTQDQKEVPTEYDGKDIIYNIIEEDVEPLMMLEASSLWKVYCKYLRGQKVARFNNTLNVDDPIRIAREMGIILGIDLAIRQISISCNAIRQSRERKEKRQDESKGKRQN